MKVLPTNKNECNDHIVWLDMEMTGINVNIQHILEIACVITDKNLQITSKNLNIVIHQPDEILNNMNDWCLLNHKKTGLIDESRSSKITIQDAEQAMLKFLKQHVGENLCPLAGNSVYMDRMFLDKYMPLVSAYLHYRIIDISTIKELFSRWCSNIPQFRKESIHRALPDIKESIEELKYYKKYMFDKCNRS